MDKGKFTVDSIWDPTVQILQSRKGYRFALDSILLAHFIHLNQQEEALEIGCGNGIILILLSRLRKYKRIVGVEIQSELADLARLNIKNNNAEKIEIIEADARKLGKQIPKKAFHLLYSNPPYRKVGSGKLNPVEEKAIARHELRLKLEDLVSIANEHLNKDGRLTVILPSFREKDWMDLTLAHGYYLQTTRSVHSFPNDPPAFILMTMSKKETLTETMSPLIIYEKPGNYTSAMKSLLNAPKSE